MKIKHIVITRFNLKIWQKDKSNRATLGEDWMEERFNLFERFCFPSLMHQSDKNFRWLCLFDSETPEKYKERVKQYQSLCPQFCPVFFHETEAHDNYKSITHQRILSEFDPSCDAFITSRLDNDDALHGDYIATINQLAKNTERTDQYCVFIYGYQYFERKNLLTRIKYPNNHFTARIEKGLTDPASIKTVFEIKHSHLRKKGIANNVYVNKISDRKRPFWIEVIHERNVANDLFLAFRIKDLIYFFQTKPEMKTRTLSEFGLDVSIEKWHQIVAFQSFYMLEVCSKILHKLVK